ncbi:hypothetical protein LUW75_11330 [Streptomyces sp. MRC013]|uniref:hypothetical protein n=1 Tax=Streptomyces sp. MRC013 TaxID=2898276 RepID=UPI0020264BDB|nr:hypothetical protein [Streptomyces sp. MRC013]URM90497.1 hypothetical protein LUW75_11330 [Streptomyces sp. MRC013]
MTGRAAAPPPGRRGGASPHDERRQRRRTARVLRRAREPQGTADTRYQQNQEWAEDPAHECYSKERGIHQQIDGAADDGDEKAEGDAGVR